MILDRSDIARCALWTLSGPVYRTAMTLVFLLPETILDSISAFIQDERGLSLRFEEETPVMTMKMLTSYTIDPVNPSNIKGVSEYEISMSCQTESVATELHIDDTGLEVRLFDHHDELSSSMALRSVEHSNNRQYHGTAADRISTRLVWQWRFQYLSQKHRALVHDAQYLQRATTKN